MNVTWFATTKYGADITAVEVSRETDKCVFLAARNGQKEDRAFKSSEYVQYWKTWDEAHRHLVERCEQKVNSLRKALARAEGELGSVRDLRAIA